MFVLRNDKIMSIMTPTNTKTKYQKNLILLSEARHTK